MSTQRWVCLDVGETIIDETRVWSAWADVLGVPRLTFMAAFGAAIDRGGQHSSVFALLERPDWRELMPQVRQTYGAFRADDLYPDAKPAIEALGKLGYRVSVLGNQPAERTEELRALGIDPEVMAMSDELGVAKPDPDFFERALELMGGIDPGSVAYVGDRVDNDIIPAVQAGMRAVWLRRGPWGVIVKEPPAEACLVIDSLAALPARIGACWDS